nr:putative ribonuclease H-like domain-containing protein [Tanacetum cinerariifolium]
VNTTNNINIVSPTDNAAGIEDNVVHENIVYGSADDPNIPALEEIGTFGDAEDDDSGDDMNNLDTYFQVSPDPTTRIHKDHPLEQVIADLHLAPQTRRMSKNLEGHGLVSTVDQRTNHKDLQNCLFACFLSQMEPKKAIQALKDPSSKWVYMNKIDERGIVIKKKARLVAQRHTQEEGIDYDEVLAPVVRIEAIRLLLAYASFKDFVVYQMDVKSAFLYGMIEEETASTPIETHKTLLKDEKGEDIDEHLYRSMIGSLMYLTSLRPNIIFATVVANFITEAEYVAALSCCGQVLWIQNQLLDYGYNFMHTKIHIDNESTIYIVKNPVFHSKTKHIEIKHQFIRHSNEKKLIQMIEIHTDKNVAYLLTKAFDAKNINKDAHIHVKVDGKKVIIFEATIRRDLKFEDEGGIDCLSNEVIFEQTYTHRVRLTTRVESSDEESLGEEDASKQGRKIANIDVDKELTLIDETTEDLGRINSEEMFDIDVRNDEEMFVESVDVAEKAKEIVVDKDLIDDITLAKALMKIKVTVTDTRPKAKSILMQSQVKLQQQQQYQYLQKFKTKERIEDENLAWDNVQAMMDADYELAAKLQEEEQGELTVEEKSRLFVELMDKRKKHFAKLRAEEQRRKPLTKAPKRNQMLVKDKTVLTQESSSKRAGDKLDQERSKKQKVEDDKESEELKRCLEIILDDEDDVTIDATHLSIKTPIIDYKIYKEGKRSYF